MGLQGSRKLTMLHAMVLYCASIWSASGAESGANIEFFEKKIRPALAEHCYKCHSANSEKIKGKLRLDSRAALLKGGETGPSIIPGNPDKSLFIEAILYANQDLQMPPKTKLSDAVAQDFTAWVKAGAPWPDEKGAEPVVEEKKLDYEKLRKEHWAFRPIQKREPPPVKDSAWPLNSVDRFVLAKLEQKELKPSPAADKRTLLRRVSFDLTGLPPTLEEIEAFLGDTSADSFAKVVDRMLASPHFGERWGRHWLDIARFAESAGGGRIVAYGNAWRYRDYVIGAFNKDKRYDDFIKEQIAGDLLPAKTLEQKHEQVIATGYLVVGPKNLDTQDKDLLRMDVVDEQLDTLGKSILGMTIGCARCHDHKFDPIPTREYYSLAGIFRSTKTLTPGNVSGVVQTVLPVDDATQLKIAEYEKKLGVLEEQLNKMRMSDGPAKSVAKTHATPAAGSKIKSKIEATSLPGIVVDNSQANIVGPWIRSTHTGVYVGEGYIHDSNKSKGEMSVSFSPSFPKSGMYEVRFSYSFFTTRADRVPVIIQHADGETTVEVDEREEPGVDGLFTSLGKFRFNQGNDGSVTVSNMGTKGVVTVDAVQFIPVEDAVAVIDPAPVKITDKPKADSVQKQESEVALMKKLENELTEFRKTAPGGPKALAVRDEEQVSDYNVCIRGDVHRLGAPAPRSFLSAVAYESPTVNPKQSGRLELAQWIVDTRNPLPPRVLVNRVWHHLFGAGLVRTTDNFGTTGETPSNPDLLDDLSARFVENGWSVKKLIREIVLSRTYQQSVAINAAAAKIDPENRMLWRGNRRRLEVEAIRDSILANSGQLDLSGSPGDTTTKAAKTKQLFRTVYMPQLREAGEDVFEIFDFADNNLVVGARNTSNLPTQALFLLNSPFVMEHSQKAAQRLLDTPNLDENARLTRAYMETLGRPPSDAERRLSHDFLAGADVQKAWAQFYQSLFACVDFRYLD